MNIRADMLDLIRSRTSGYALSRPFYTDAEVFRFDIETIWYRDWLFAIPACESAGRQLCDDAGRRVPDRHRARSRRKIRAFHNACRHRGSRVCTAHKGSAPKLVCPHHQWTYELDGRLLYARDMGPEFDASKHGLKPVASEEAAGVVYVCLADEPPSIEAFLESANRYKRRSGAGRSRFGRSPEPGRGEGGISGRRKG